MDFTLQKLVGVIILGISLHWLAWRIRIPSIVLFFAAGVLIGPAWGWVDPSEDFGPLLQALIKLAIAIILFEGGLNLRFHELRQSGRAVKQIILLGLPLSWGFGFAACHWVAGLSVPVSVLLSAILVVTGPTVILPLVRHAKLSPRTASVLKWEGIINDPIGVLLAVLVAEILTHDAAQTTQSILAHFGLAIAGSIALGIAGGLFLKFAFEKGHVPEFLKIPMVLCMVISLFGIANLLAEEMGLLAVTVLGITMGNIRMLIFYELRRFKENITTLLVATVFILLTAELEAKHFANLDWRALGFILSILFLVRPLAVGLGTLGAGLKWNETLLLGWIAPRGIVAASVAGLFAPRLIERGYDDAVSLLPLVFGVIVFTVVLHGLSLEWLARRLELSSDKQEGVVIVGANPWTTELASVLRELDLPVVLVDGAWHRLKDARLRGLPVHYGEILSETSEQNMDLAEMGYLLAASENDAYNALVCNAFIHHFGRDRVYQLPFHAKKVDEDKGVHSAHLGRIAFDDEARFEVLMSCYYQGWTFQKSKLTEEHTFDAFVAKLQSPYYLILLTGKGKLAFGSENFAAEPAPGDTVIAFAKPEPAHLKNGGKKVNC
ncbi:cation:proton antiporter [Nitrospina gracilis]|uniref:cation:proton antiporter n=1 Tax=Nitrospina gracilis TaxID=35801 RepID=UPI001F02C4AD|nr:sodium:proton antiporter [Nitrospina gracilis]MCF8721667.1 NhaP-type Na+/H+ or K+/H+ antiporter [Nitrospina gracilis Nb-211]